MRHELATRAKAYRRFAAATHANALLELDVPQSREHAQWECRPASCDQRRRAALATGAVRGQRPHREGSHSDSDEDYGQVEPGYPDEKRSHSSSLSRVLVCVVDFHYTPIHLKKLGNEKDHGDW